ncbi:PilZ domain-containing protein [Acetitomaculum ruminis DSM 5522]|uniref:PilZ domain-containing protein n=1 Tax=Acetitomaculum ruminis DSM 5522 TaxID=1120918 RepID=A0A1I0WWV7_9FIRM|nr:PilZ domain-containing protein [Acetitomaculum ruminis]SFA92650.1 PilZ domain-containing protein [Acetitomaculum ruminis DSM 5522]
MSAERRKYKRLPLDVSVQLECISEEEITTEKYLHVETMDISTAGLAFKSSYELNVGTFYDTRIIIWTKEEIHTVLKIIRSQKVDDGFVYGCIFIGLPERESIKIEIYQLLKERDDQESN